MRVSGSSSYLSAGVCADYQSDSSQRAAVQLSAVSSTAGSHRNLSPPVGSNQTVQLLCVSDRVA